MAKKLTADNDTGKGTSAGHNIENIDASIRHHLDEILAIEGEIKAKNAEHIDPLKTERRDRVLALKALDIPAKVTNAWLTILREADKARDFDDDADKAKTIDALDRVYEAVYGKTAAGETISILDVLERLGVPPAEEDEEKPKPKAKAKNGSIDAAPAGNA